MKHLSKILLLLCFVVPLHAAEIAISALGAASSPSGSELVPCVQSATTKKCTVTQINSLSQPLDSDLTSLAAAMTSGDVPLASIAQGTALSVLGVTGNATADYADITAGT